MWRRNRVLWLIVFFYPSLPPKRSGCHRWCTPPLATKQSHQMRDCSWPKVIQNALLLRMGLNPELPSASPAPSTAPHWFHTCTYQHGIWYKISALPPIDVHTAFTSMISSPVGKKFIFALLALVSAFLITDRFLYSTNVIVFLPGSRVHRSPINFCLSRHVKYWPI